MFIQVKRWRYRRASGPSCSLIPLAPPRTSSTACATPSLVLLPPEWYADLQEQGEGEEGNADQESVGFLFSLSLSIYLSIYLSLSLYLFVCLSVCLTFYLTLSLSPSLILSLSLSLSLSFVTSLCLKQLAELQIQLLGLHAGRSVGRVALVSQANKLALIILY